MFPSKKDVILTGITAIFQSSWNATIEAQTSNRLLLGEKWGKFSRSLIISSNLLGY